MPGNRAILPFLSPPATISLVVLALAMGHMLRSSPPGLILETDSFRLVADGFSTTRLLIRASQGDELSVSAVTLDIVEGARRARIEGVTPVGGTLQAVVRAGILPGPVVIEARAGGFTPTRIRLETVLDPFDRANDGTPDFLRLDDDADRHAFQRWFTFLAESQFYRSTERLPAEISDCAALIRFAYREALREHDGAWASELELEDIFPGPSVQKYQYPFTPLGAGLFRVKPGAFRSEDIGNGAFAQFANAQALRRLNTHFISRDIRLAQPGDLLFYRQLEQDLPFHAMIFVGPSHFEPGSAPWVVYHTGPMGKTQGEIRRLSVDELLRHPSPRWRPLVGNSNFLGIYRWNILRGSD